MELQELVARARILFNGATKRFQVFQKVNGRHSAKDIALSTGRALTATLEDLQKMRDMDLIRSALDNSSQPIKKNGSIVYEKNPLLKHLSNTYFAEPTKLPKKKPTQAKQRSGQATLLRVPSEREILDICKSGESQLYEFKAAGTESKKITKELAAFANTKNGGIVLYGVEDDGTIAGSDLTRQVFDQKIQNSVRNSIEPALHPQISEKDVLGYKIMLVRIPPRDPSHVFLYEGRALLRQGTNAFIAKPDQLKKLYAGKQVA